MDSFRQHTADVLALAASPDGSAVFAAGVDGKVICLQKSASNAEATLFGTAGGRSRSNSVIAPAAADNTWVYVHAHRAHSHDVLALAVVAGPTAACNNTGSVESVDKKKVSFAGLAEADRQQHLVLLSGGVDTRLCTYSVDNFVRTRPTWIPPIPTNSLIHTSSAQDMPTLRNREYIDIWGVGLQQLDTNSQSAISSSSSSAATVNGNDCKLRLRVQLKGNDHIHCSALSANGNHCIQQ